MDERLIKSAAFKRLCHLAALADERDKRKAVVDGLVVTAMLYKDGPWEGPADWQLAIEDIYELHLPQSELQDSIDRCLEDGRILPTRGRQYYLSPKTRSAAEEDIRVAEALEASVRDSWLSAVMPSMPNGVEAETMWSVLQEYMASAFRQHGVETVGLLTDTGREETSRSSMAQHLQNAINESELGPYGDEVAEAVKSFFSSTDATRLAYILQLLEGTVSFLAIGVDPETLEFLRGALPPLNIFLDTNIIFGLLDIHDNPMAGVSRQVINTISENRLPFTLYYHERTLRETEDTIEGIGNRLRSRKWSPSLSRAILSMSPSLRILSGVEIRYHQLNSRTPTPVDAFLSRYANITELLKLHGCKPYRDPPTAPEAVQQKGELIAEYREFVDRGRPGRKRPYEALDHDIILWLAVQERRKSGVRTTLRSGALLLSADFLLWRFDWQHLKLEYNSVPCVVLPNSLMEILRPFSSAIPNFDSAFVQTFSAPEFRVMGGDADKTIKGVMAYLATFEDLPEETAKRILADSVLTKRLGKISDTSPEFRSIMDEAINATLLEEKMELEKELREVRHEREQKPAEVETAASQNPSTTEERPEVAKDAVQQQIEEFNLVKEQLENALDEQRSRTDQVEANFGAALEEQRSQAQEVEANLKGLLEEHQSRTASVEAALEKERTRTHQVEAELQARLEEERSKAENAQRRADHYARMLSTAKIISVVLFALIATVLTYRLHYAAPLPWLSDHPNRLGIFLSCLGVIFGASLVPFRKTRNVGGALLVLAVGALLTLISKGK